MHSCNKALLNTGDNEIWTVNLLIVVITTNLMLLSTPISKMFFDLFGYAPVYNGMNKTQSYQKYKFIV